jgi:hypothetical protein
LVYARVSPFIVVLSASMAGWVFLG